MSGFGSYNNRTIWVDQFRDTRKSILICSKNNIKKNNTQKKVSENEGEITPGYKVSTERK